MMNDRRRPRMIVQVHMIAELAQRIAELVHMIAEVHYMNVVVG